MPKADAVFEGGGVKGIGLVGALSVAESKGYVWENVAGTSAGAIVAALVAAGYEAAELKKMIGSLDYNRFKDKGAVDRIPLFGPLVSLLSEKGIYEGNFLEDWIRELLLRKGVRTFGDLVRPGEKDKRYKYKLNVIAADVTNELLVVLPTGIEKYGENPDRLEVAKAVRMSMSIPLFFEPVKFRNNYFVDGGILSNFPVWLFDSPGIPEWPTFGFKLIEPDYGKPNRIEGPLDFLKSIVGTMMDAHDKLHVENNDIVRTIGIPTLGIKTTEFEITPERTEKLYQSGVSAATDFFKTWNFKKYIQAHRAKKNPKWLSKIEQLRRVMVT
jgi:NTE family protein